MKVFARVEHPDSGIVALTKPRRIVHYYHSSSAGFSGLHQPWGGFRGDAEGGKCTTVHIHSVLSHKKLCDATVVRFP